MKRRYRFQWQPRRRVMGRVIMKWGGGLISDKTTLCTPYIERILSLGTCVKQLVEMGHSVVIVHGAGSYGHILARKFRLSEGNIDGLDQYAAVQQVRSDMDLLHQIVISSLEPLEIMSHPPRDFIKNTGPGFTGDLYKFQSSDTHVTFGDVVDCDLPHEFGILSGDDLMLRLCTELPDVTHAIFAMGETPGLMTSSGTDGQLIPISDTNMQFSGEHIEDIDVTGGIFLKASRAAEISKHVEHVWFIDGTHIERILQIVESGHTHGTRIVNP